MMIVVPVKYKSIKDLNGSLFITPSSNLDGCLEIKSRSDLDGSLSIKTYENSIDLDGTLNIIYYDFSDLDGSFEIDLKTREADLNGAISFTGYTDSSYLNGSFYISEKAYLNASIVISQNMDSNDLSGKLEINHHSDCVDLEGSINIPVERQSYINGRFEINRYTGIIQDLDGSITVKTFYRYLYFDGMINIQYYSDSDNLNGSLFINQSNENNDLESRLEISRIIDDIDLNGSIDIPLERHIYLPGSLNINSDNDSTDFEGSLEVVYNKFLNGTLSIDSYEESDDFDGKLFISFDRSANLPGLLEIDYFYQYDDFKGSLNIIHHADINGSLEINSYKDINTDLNGALKVSLDTNRLDLKGRIYIPLERSKELSGSIKIPYFENQTDLEGSIYIPSRKDIPGSLVIIGEELGHKDLNGTINIPSLRNIDLYGNLKIPKYYERKGKFLNGSLVIRYSDNRNDIDGKLHIYIKDNFDLNGTISIKQISITDMPISVTVPRPQIDLDGKLAISRPFEYTLLRDIEITVPNPEVDLDGKLEIVYPFEYTLLRDIEITVPRPQIDLDGRLTISRPFEDILFKYIKVTVPKPEVDLEGSILVVYPFENTLLRDIEITVPKPEVDLEGQLAIRYPFEIDLISISVGVAVTVRPEQYEPIVGDYIVEIPWPNPQLTNEAFTMYQVKYPPGQTPFRMDLTLFSTGSPDNLFIPRRFYEKYDENHVIVSNELDLNEGDEIRFLFCHNDGKYHVQKLEFYYKAQGNASYYYLDMDSPYKKNINNSTAKFLVFVNRRLVVPYKDYVIDDELGRLTFVNDTLAKNPEDRIDVVCFFTGIDDTAVADLPMSGYIYLKRNMIDRNYNNNLMATFINGRLIRRDKILHISNNIYKIKEDIKSRHDLQILNMSNCIDCMVPFYKQSSKFPFTKTSMLDSAQLLYNQRAKYIEWEFPVSITIPALATYGRQHLTMYHNPVYFSPEFLLENKNNYLSIVHVASPADLNYTLTFYANDTDPNPSTMNIKVELHLKTPFEEQKEESRSSILLCVLPAQVTAIHSDYCYCSLQIKQIINLDFWNKQFLESCDGITIRMEPGVTHYEQPSEVYFNMQANQFEDFEKEQISVFEYRITDSYDGLGNVNYIKHITFNPEESNKASIRNSNDNKT